MQTVILLGSGSSRDRRIKVNGKRDFVDQRVISVDIYSRHSPSIAWDLNRTPWPFDDNTADEIHAYEILEHLGTQGDAKSFFETFYEIWRILKPGGSLAATVPSWKSMWAWGDPSHTRVINEGSLVFLSQEQYRKQVGVTAMSDFRDIWLGDFEIPPDTWCDAGVDQFSFVLRAIK